MKSPPEDPKGNSQDHSSWHSIVKIVLSEFLGLASQSVNKWHVWEESIFILRVAKLSEKLLDIFLGDFISKIGKDVFELSKHHGSVVVFVIQLQELNVVVVGS
eukprot:TRINITY_DN34_c0_g1_i31.p2 TRINITY_DN34_c0_g1~~TRINITY_DN34_c0_g1_i31.p2  ORF type:complete len:103 (-),score=21.88 TRINITY_DN34_c0_g1_i31:37-345(-)